MSYLTTIVKWESMFDVILALFQISQSGCYHRFYCLFPIDPSDLLSDCFDCFLRVPVS